MSLCGFLAIHLPQISLLLSVFHFRGQLTPGSPLRERNPHGDLCADGHEGEGKDAGGGDKEKREEKGG